MMKISAIALGEIRYSHRRVKSNSRVILLSTNEKIYSSPILSRGPAANNAELLQIQQQHHISSISRGDLIRGHELSGLRSLPVKEPIYHPPTNNNHFVQRPFHVEWSDECLGCLYEISARRWP